MTYTAYREGERGSEELAIKSKPTLMNEKGFEDITARDEVSNLHDLLTVP